MIPTAASKTSYSQNYFYMSVTTPLAKDKLLLKSFQGEESLSKLFHFSVEMVSKDNKISADSLLGKNIAIEIVYVNGKKHYLHGLVGKLVQYESTAKFTTYRAELYPWFWMLTLSKNCRIFQNKKVSEIIKAIFVELGFTNYKISLKGTHVAREYCVQYNETDFDFISRLMEEEGLFYFFEHEKTKHTLVIADDASAHSYCPDFKTATYRQSAHEWIFQDNYVTSCEIENQLVCGEYSHTDYNFETPSTDIFSKVTGKGSKMKVYEYPGNYSKKNQGDALSKIRIEEEEFSKLSLKGESICRAFRAGHKFDLKSHYRQDANTTYVLEKVIHSATHESYKNSFEAFPVKTPFRAPRITPKKRITGCQTALVVGKKGEEIWTDKYGRIKVQFYWDRKGKKNENSSCWIRVNQHWAGKNWGAMFLPRVGQEVIVNFLEGDPDRPIVIGALYNGEQTLPYTLPGAQTKSTIKSNSSKGGKGFNEIRFEDKKSSEEVYLHAQKDMTVKIEHDRTEEVLNDEKITIKNNRTVTIQDQNDKLILDKGNLTTQVKKGNETHEVKGKRDLTITGNETHTNKANFKQTVTGNFDLNVTGNLTIKATGSITLQSAAGINVKAGTSISQKAGVSMTNEAGVSITSKASASHNVEASGVMVVKGAVVKIN